MSIGKLRKRLVIEALQNNVAATGDNQPTYASTATVWGSIEQLSQRDLTLLQQKDDTHTATHKIRIRFRSDIKVGFHRVRYGSNPGIDLENLTDDQLRTLDDNALNNLPDTTGMRIFAINDIQNEQELNRFLILICTEVIA